MQEKLNSIRALVAELESQAEDERVETICGGILSLLDIVEVLI